jgi:hypothetical protein
MDQWYFQPANKKQKVHSSEWQNNNNPRKDDVSVSLSMTVSSSAISGTSTTCGVSDAISGTSTISVSV